MAHTLRQRGKQNRFLFSERLMIQNQNMSEQNCQVTMRCSYYLILWGQSRIWASSVICVLLTELDLLVLVLQGKDEREPKDESSDERLRRRAYERGCQRLKKRIEGVADERFRNMRLLQVTDLSSVLLQWWRTCRSRSSGCCSTTRTKIR